MAHRTSNSGEFSGRWGLWAGRKRGSALPLELDALLPNRRYNDDLIAGLETLKLGPQLQAGAIAAVFAADPFLNVRLLAVALSRAGVRRVGNFPSVAQYGDAFEQTLAEVELGVDRELSILRQFRDLGFVTYQTVAGNAAGRPDEEGRTGYLIGLSFDDLRSAAGPAAAVRSRRASVIARVGAGREVLICRPPALGDERATIMTWPLD